MEDSDFSKIKVGTILKCTRDTLSDVLMLKQLNPSKFLVKWAVDDGIYTFNRGGGIRDFEIVSDPTEETLRWVEEVCKEKDKELRLMVQIND